jgi:predicted ABC-type transport system involved in lysophospholipase L1 biosynthesis ATPase subunit
MGSDREGENGVAIRAVEIPKVYCREHAVTLALVTHDEELAASCMDRVARLVDGQIAAGGI